LSPDARGESQFLHSSLHFDGHRANASVGIQVGFGPRVSGTPEHLMTAQWIEAEMTSFGYEFLWENFSGWRGAANGVAMFNLIAKKPVSGNSDADIIMVGAHYDTRSIAERDPNPELQGDPIIGANDGASGVAALIELGRVLQSVSLETEIWFYFIDGEDYELYGNDSMFYGSEYAADNMPQSIIERTRWFILLDMIGDKDLDIRKEVLSGDPILNDMIWENASVLGYSDSFLNDDHYVIDDHQFIGETGIRVTDLIDFNYGSSSSPGPHWHTHNDTWDKVSASSLETVGRTIERFLLLEGGATELPLEEGLVIVNSTTFTDQDIHLNGSLIIEADLNLIRATVTIYNPPGAKRGLLLRPLVSLNISESRINCSAQCSVQIQGMARILNSTLTGTGAGTIIPSGFESFLTSVEERIPGYQPGGILVSGSLEIRNSSVATTSNSSAITILGGQLRASELNLIGGAAVVAAMGEVELMRSKLAGHSVALFVGETEFEFESLQLANISGTGIWALNSSGGLDNVSFQSVQGWEVDLWGTDANPADLDHSGGKQLRRHWFWQLNTSSLTCSEFNIELNSHSMETLLSNSNPGFMEFWLPSYNQTLLSTVDHLPLTVKVTCDGQVVEQVISSLASNPQLQFEMSEFIDTGSDCCNPVKSNYTSMMASVLLLLTIVFGLFFLIRLDKLMPSLNLEEE